MATSTAADVATTAHGVEGSNAPAAQANPTSAAHAVVRPAAPARLPSPARSAMHAVEIPLSDILLPWLDVFHLCTTKWGLVTDVRVDGTTYKRHGIIVELSVNITDALASGWDTAEWKLRRIRQGIDLVKLTLAVDPHALMSLFSRESLLVKDESRDRAWSLDLEKADLEAVSRGEAPFELRLMLQFKTKALNTSLWGLEHTFMKKLDQEQVRASRSSPTFVRDYLLEQCKPSQYDRLVHVPVHAVLMVEPQGENASDMKIDEPRATNFLVACAKSVGALHVYQQSSRDKTWEIAAHYAPLFVEKIDLRLVYVPLTRNVMNAITLLMGKGIPVSSSHLYLDLRFVPSGEQQLQRFLDAIVAYEQDQIIISTGWMVPSNLKALDTNGQDFTTRITTVLRCIGRLSKDIQFEIGCLFELFKDSINRLAIIRGLVAFLLTRSRPIYLVFDDYELREQVRA